MRKVDIRITVTEEFGTQSYYVVSLTKEGIEGAIQMASDHNGVERQALRDFLHRSIEDAVVNWVNDSPGAKRSIERRQLEREIGGPITATSLQAHILSKLNREGDSNA